MFIYLLALIPIERYLQISAAWGPDFSPDDSALLYMTNLTGEAQAWLKPADACPVRITFEAEPINYALFHPVRDWILFGMDREGTERNQLYLYYPENGEVDRLTPNDSVIYRFGDWSPDGRILYYSSNERNGRDFDIFAMNLEDRSVREIYRGKGYMGISSISPTGRYMVLYKYSANVNNDLYLLDLKKNRLKHITPHEGNAVFRDINWLPGDSGFFLLTDRGRDFYYIAYYDLKRDTIVPYKGFDWDVENISLSRDGRYLYYSINEHGYSRGYVLDRKSGKTKKVPLEDGVLSSGVFSHDSKSIALVYSSPTDNADIYLYYPAEDSVVQMTNSPTAGIPPSTFRAPRLVSYESFDGTRIYGFLYTPDGPPPYPTILYFHGGPEGQTRPYFSRTFQFFLSRGYAIFAPNIRGSRGYGKKFLAMDNGARRFDALKDGEYAYRFLKENGIASKVCVMGASYGGYMTLAMLAFYPHLFDCGVDIVGISNFLTFLQNTGPWRRKLRVAEYGDPEKERDILIRLSPYYRVDSIRAPLLVIHGKNDPRVPYTEAEQIVEALRERGVPVEYLLFEDEGHGIAKLENRIKAYRKIEEFFEKYLKGEH